MRARAVVAVTLATCVVASSGHAPTLQASHRRSIPARARSDIQGAGHGPAKQPASVTALSLRGGATLSPAMSALLSPTQRSSAAAMLGTTVACLGMHQGLKRWVLPAIVGKARWHRKMDAESRHLFVHDAVSSFILSPVLVWLYATAALELLAKGGVKSRWEGTTRASRLGLAMHLGLNLYDFFYAYPLDVNKSWVYYAHHVAVMACLLPVLYLERLHFFAMCTALIEATNPLVGACQNIDRAKVIGDPDLKHKGKGWATAQLVLGGLLLTCWFSVRLCGLPLVLAAFVRDWPAYFGYSAVGSAVDSALGPVVDSSSLPGSVETGVIHQLTSTPGGDSLLVLATRSLAAASITASGFIWLLSCMWFVEMAQLARAALKSGGENVLSKGK